MVRIKKIMLRNVPTLGIKAKIEEAAKLLAKEENGCVVITQNDAPIGIITELDFVRNFVSKGPNFVKDNVGKIMTSPVTFMTPEMKLDEALKIIDTKRFRRYPVIEDKKLVGFVTKKDIVNNISDNVKFHRNIQNAVLTLFVLFEFFIFAVNTYLHKG